MLISNPKYTLIEQTAIELAGCWYDIGRQQSLKSKHKTARLYAKHNFTKFIPKAIECLLAQLNDETISPIIKEQIYEALMERHNDPTLNAYMPNNDIDITKIIGEKPLPPVIVNTSDYKKRMN